jgi:hypothetical protein
MRNREEVQLNTGRWIQHLRARLDFTLVFHLRSTLAVGSGIHGSGLMTRRGSPRFDLGHPSKIYGAHSRDHSSNCDKINGPSFFFNLRSARHDIVRTPRGERTPHRVPPTAYRDGNG